MHPNHNIKLRIVALWTLLILCSSGSESIISASDEAFGSWNIYNAALESTQMQVFGDRIFMVNTSSLTSIDLDLDEDSQLSYSRNTGLSSSSVSMILNSKEAEKLAIVYADGNIDLMDLEGNIHSIPDLATKPMNGDKTIYSLRECHGKLFASGGFGILIIDMRQNMILSHYPTSYPISFSFELDGIVYRYSEQERLEYLQPGRNGNDPTSWQRYSHVRTLKDAFLFTQDESVDHCYAITGNGELVELKQDEVISSGNNKNYKRIFPIHQQLILQGDVLTLFNPADNSFTNNGYSPYKDCIDYAAINDTACYMLHSYYGLFPARFTNYVPNQSLFIEGEYSEGAFAQGIATSYLGEMAIHGQELMGISRRSYVTGYTAAQSLNGVITRLDTQTGDITNTITRQILPMLPEGMNFMALSGLAINPTDPAQYAISSGLFGLYIFQGDSVVEAFDGKNSIGQIEAFSPDFTSTRVSAVAYDDDGNLFVANSMQDTILRCRTSQGQWIKYPNPGMAQVAEARRILIPRYGEEGLKWVLNDYGYQKSRVGIYADGGRPQGVSSASYSATYFNTLVDQDGNEYIPNYMYDLCEDKEGKIWVLTSNGPFVIEDPEATFRYATTNPGKGKVRRVKIPRNDGTNLADYLMVSTQSTCMAIDNYNRKWIGTYGSGLYLMSSDCITEIEHFQMDNSPLLSNDILDLCYDPESGILYISCQGGVVTYQTDAIEGAEDFDGLYCYPNPVRPNYNGELRIMGLMNDSQVSITTTNGDLIYTTVSQGATTTWDLRTSGGQRVNPGVYLIHGIDQKGKKGSICRFLVL